MFTSPEKQTLTPKEKAIQHYHNAVEARKRLEPQAALDEITKALDVENQQEYFFERAWAEIELALFEEAATSLRMVAHMGETRPSPLVIEKEVVALTELLNSAQIKLKKVKKALNAAVKNKSALDILAAVINKPSIDLEELVRASVRLKTVAGGVSVGCSKIGGVPDFINDEVWPRTDKGQFLEFLCQVKMSVLTGETSDTELLLFFCSSVDQLVDDDFDEKNWRVLLQDGKSNREADDTSIRTGLCVYKEKGLVAEIEKTLPDVDKLFKIEELSNSVKALYLDATEKLYGKQPWHRHGGNSQDVQGEMEPELYDRFGIQKENEWQLLLQLDTDNSTGMCWGDGGRLYFWIREKDFLAKNFQNVQMMMQSY